MRITVLLCDATGSAAPFAALDPPADPSRWAPEHEWSVLTLSKATAVPQLIQAARQEVDVYLNLCDGAWDEDRPGLEVVQALERLGQPYTGAGPGCYDPSRLAMKMACHASGIAFPDYAFGTAADAVRIAERLGFPLIVKHPQSYASVGLTRDSVVTDLAALHRELDRIATAYGSALVERFIEGTECTVLVAEPLDGRTDPVTYQPIQYVFPEGERFKHFDMKWVDHHKLAATAVADQGLSDRLRADAAALFTALGMSGYARVDVRVDADGTPHVLEINPNCSVFYPPDEFGSADLVLGQDPVGHRGFLAHILDCAVRRHQRQRPAVAVDYHPRSGFGLYALSPIPAGTILMTHEERSQRLVSRDRVERTWNGLDRLWFDEYAWPISDDVYAIWSDDPEQWRPINHSCDPSAWLVGLDLVSRHDLAAGEQVTVDYATFAGPAMPPFECGCGADSCRGTVQSSDTLLPEVQTRYSGHLSAWVRARTATSGLS